MQFNNKPTGASKNQVLSTFGDLESDIGKAFASGLGNGGVLENLLLTDWNKLHTIGTKIQNADEGSAWFWGPDVTPKIATNLANAFTVSFYQALMPAKYQIVTFFGVPFSDPSSYSYISGCPNSMCICAEGIYSPPSGAWFDNGGGSTNNIFMAISPSDGSYPSNTLTSKLFCMMNLYYVDFFFSARGWSAMTEVLPQGWSLYQQSGLCSSEASLPVASKTDSSRARNAGRGPGAPAIHATHRSRRQQKEATGKSRCKSLLFFKRR
jgi:hypothetical protein